MVPGIFVLCSECILRPYVSSSIYYASCMTRGRHTHGGGGEASRSGMRARRRALLWIEMAFILLLQEDVPQDPGRVEACAEGGGECGAGEGQCGEDVLAAEGEHDLVPLVLPR